MLKEGGGGGMHVWTSCVKRLLTSFEGLREGRVEILV